MCSKSYSEREKRTFMKNLVKIEKITIQGGYTKDGLEEP
jgi:hypothetical protein